MNNSTIIVDAWNIQQSFGIVLLVLAFCYFMLGRVPLVFILCYGYFSLSGIFSGFFLNALQATLFVALYAFLPEKWIKPLLTIIIGAITVDAIWLLFGNKYGLFNASTFDASIMACLLPLVLRGPFIPIFKYLCTSLLVLCILVTGGSTGLLCLYVLALLWRVWLIIPFILIGIALKWDVLFDPNGRLEGWSTYMKFWYKNADHWLGFGFGSFEAVGLRLPVNGVLYRFMHSDYLQILFETGIVGLALMLTATVWLFKNVKRREFFILTFIAMMTYFPTHFAIFQLLFLLVLKRETSSENDYAYFLTDCL